MTPLWRYLRYAICHILEETEHKKSYYVPPAGQSKLGSHCVIGGKYVTIKSAIREIMSIGIIVLIVRARLVCPI